MSVYAGAAVAEYAIAELPSSLDQGVPDPLSALLANPRAKRTYLLEGSPLDSDGVAVDVRWSNDGYATFPADTPANQLYRALLEAPYNAQLSILRSDGRPGGGSSPTFGDVTAINTSRRSAGSIVYDLDAHLGYSWAGQAITIKVGAPAFLYSEFGTIFSGTAAGIRADDMESISLPLRDYSYKLQKPIQTTLYMGTGPCLRLDGVDDRVDYGDILDQGAADSFSLDILFRSSTTGTVKVLVAKKADLVSAAGFAFFFNASNNLIGRIADGTSNVSATLSAGSVYLDGNLHRGTMVVDRTAQVIKLIVDGELVATSASISGIGSLTSASALQVGAAVSTNFWLGDLDDFRFWPSARSLVSSTADMFRELTTTEATSCAIYSKFNEATGTSAADSSGNSRTGTITGATWVGSYEGAQDIAGKPKPLGWGQVRQAQPVLIDSGNLVYQFASGSSSAVDAIEDQGVALTSAGNVADLYATTVTAGQYKTDLTRSYFRLGAKPTGVLTVDFQGDNSGAGYVSTVPDIIQRIVTNQGGLVAGDLDSDAFAAVEAQNSSVAGYWVGTEAEMIDEAVTALMESILGWWTYTRAGKLTMGIVTAPSLPSVYLDENDIIVGAIERPTPPQPVYRWRVGYRHNWLTQESDALAGSLSEEDKSLRKQGWRYATSEDSSILTRYPEAIEVTLDTHLDTLAAAQSLANSLLSIYSVERATYRLPLVNGLFVYQIGDIIRPTVARYDLGSGKDLMVTGFVEDVANQEIVLEAWG